MQFTNTNHVSSLIYHFEPLLETQNDIDAVYNEWANTIRKKYMNNHLHYKSIPFGNLNNKRRKPAGLDLNVHNREGIPQRSCHINIQLLFLLFDFWLKWQMHISGNDLLSLKPLKFLLFIVPACKEVHTYQFQRTCRFFDHYRCSVVGIGFSSNASVALINFSISDVLPGKILVSCTSQSITPTS